MLKAGVRVNRSQINTGSAPTSADNGNPIPNRHTRNQTDNMLSFHSTVTPEITQDRNPDTLRETSSNMVESKTLCPNSVDKDSHLDEDRSEYAAIDILEVEDMVELEKGKIPKNLSSKDKGHKIKIGASTNTSLVVQRPTVEDLEGQVQDHRISSATLFEICTRLDKEKSKKIKKAVPKAASSTIRKTVVPKESMTARPQVEIIDGRIVIKESSLTLPLEKTNDIDEFEEVEEDIFPTAKYSSFRQSTHGPVWGIDETRRFYEALSQCGTDFSLMQVFFPRRTRKQLKRKFYREESQHPELIKHTLQVKLPLDLEPFENNELTKYAYGSTSCNEDKKASTAAMVDV